MKHKRFGITTIFIILVTILSMSIIAQGAALTPGATYTVSVEAVNSDGTVTTDLGITTTAVADADGKLAFTLSSGIPTSASYNFLVVTATDGTVTRKAVVAAPATGGSVDLGLSETSTVQANAVLSAFEASGSDNALIAAIISLTCRSGALNEYETKYLALGMKQCVLGPDKWLSDFAALDPSYMDTGPVDLTDRGLVPYLITKGYADYLNSFYTEIRERFYLISALMKESVDSYFAESKNNAEEAKKRGEAAGKVIDILVEAASAAGIDTEDFLNAFPEMGIVMVCVADYMADYIAILIENGGDDLVTANAWLNTHLGLTVTDINDFAANFPCLDKVALSMEDGMRQGVMKGKAKAMLEKYEAGLTTLNATDSQKTRFTEATAALTNAMVECFQEFDEVFDNPDDMPTEDEIKTAQEAIDAAMNDAFNEYMTNTQSTEDEIDGTKPDHTPVANADNDGLRWKIAKALGLKYYKWADRWGNSDDQAGTYLGDDVGKFWGQNGQAWIPITMAVVYNWAADILENGGYITYYGSASSSADDASVDDYSALYVHSGTGGRANSDVPIPEMMSWLKEIDNFFVGAKDDGAKTVTDPIKHYSDDEYENQLFGICAFGEGGATYTQKATIVSNTSDTLTLDDVSGIDANSMYFIYSNDPIRTNFVLKDFAKYRDHITTNALTKTFVTLSNLKAIRQDIEIIEFNFFSTFDQGPVDDSVFQAANEVKKARLDDLVKHIGGVQDSSGTPITPAQKEALVLMFVQPDF
ncbi:MAG: hypothetical protein B1H13_06825 [Desulfobacteraceae bacterium 4484_190.3]|nr:MAG: hypothetical protein B1H13_06825 [Desulfobacteraceae bacterium 4484_190.3]